MKFITDIPAVENFDSWNDFDNSYPTPKPNMCAYIAQDDTYYAYIDGILFTLETVATTLSDSFIITYATVNDSTMTTQLFDDWFSVTQFISQNRTILTDISIYYGSTTEPQQKCRIVPATSEFTIHNMAYIEAWELVDNFYIWKPIGIIYPKIIFNGHVMTL